VYTKYYKSSLNDACSVSFSVHALAAFIIDGLSMYILSPVRDHVSSRWRYLSKSSLLSPPGSDRWR